MVNNVKGPYTDGSRMDPLVKAKIVEKVENRLAKHIIGGVSPLAVLVAKIEDKKEIVVLPTKLIFEETVICSASSMFEDALADLGKKYSLTGV